MACVVDEAGYDEAACFRSSVGGVIDVILEWWVRVSYSMVWMN